jgi:hypothetical protein
MNEKLWSIGGMTMTGKAKVLEEKPVPVPLCPPYMPQYLTWD